MSKILEASCDANGKVTADGAEVPEAVVLSLGKKASTGVLLLDGEKACYFPSSATDIQDLIENVVGIIDQTKLILAGLDAVSTSPGSQASNIAQLEVLKTQLDQTKEQLK